MKKIYRNGQADIGFEFEYETEKDLRFGFESLTFELLDFIDDYCYNMKDELIEHLNNAGFDNNFKAEIIEDMDDYLGDDWYEHLGN